MVMMVCKRIGVRLWLCTHLRQAKKYFCFAQSLAKRYTIVHTWFQFLHGRCDVESWVTCNSHVVTGCDTIWSRRGRLYHCRDRLHTVGSCARSALSSKKSSENMTSVSMIDYQYSARPTQGSALLFLPIAITLSSTTKSGFHNCFMITNDA